MAADQEVAELKQKLEELAAEFRRFRDQAAPLMREQSEADVEGQEVHCTPCITWTSI